VLVRILDRGPAPTNEQHREGINAAATRAGLAGGGLGLFAAARLIQAMDGRSWATARPEGGAEFGFAVPRSRRPTPPDQEKPALATPSPAAREVPPAAAGRVRARPARAG
jgi:K+-sensing histidine kinase KdpD